MRYNQNQQKYVPEMQKISGSRLEGNTHPSSGGQNSLSPDKREGCIRKDAKNQICVSIHSGDLLGNKEAVNSTKLSFQNNQ